MRIKIYLAGISERRPMDIRPPWNFRRGDKFTRSLRPPSYGYSSSAAHWPLDWHQSIGGEMTYSAWSSRPASYRHSNMFAKCSRTHERSRARSVYWRASWAGPYTGSEKLICSDSCSPIGSHICAVSLARLHLSWNVKGFRTVVPKVLLNWD